MNTMDVREKLVEILKQAPFEGKVLDEWWWEEKIKRIADHLIRNGVTVQDWVSVKDRLPDATGRYLAVKKRIAPDALGGNRTDIVILRFFEDFGFKMPIHIPDWINEEINDEVTHWMPLPKPPKGE